MKHQQVAGLVGVYHCIILLVVAGVSVGPVTGQGSRCCIISDLGSPHCIPVLSLSLSLSHSPGSKTDQVAGWEQVGSEGSKGGREGCKVLIRNNYTTAVAFLVAVNLQNWVRSWQ